jgi:hypothetical protein
LPHFRGIRGPVGAAYRNTTEEWVKLTWAEGGEQRELVTTPGHNFLDRFGNFPTIDEMLEKSRATVVLASGELIEVTAERITYSAQTAHLFEQAQVAVENTRFCSPIPPKLRRCEAKASAQNMGLSAPKLNKRVDARGLRDRKWAVI